MSLILAVSAGCVVAACGSDGDASNDTLPPISTTTTTTTLPPTTTTIPSEHVIARGETLFQIAELYGLSFAELAAYNNITDPDDIQAGQTLRIPQPGETTTTTVPVVTIGPESTTTVP